MQVIAASLLRPCCTVPGDAGFGSTIPAGGTSAAGGSSGCPKVSAGPDSGSPSLPWERGEPRPTSEKPLNGLLQGRGERRGGLQLHKIRRTTYTHSPPPPPPQSSTVSPHVGGRSSQPGLGQWWRGTPQQRKGSFGWGQDAERMRGDTFKVASCREGREFPDGDTGGERETPRGGDTPGG